MKSEVPNAFHNVFASPYWENHLFDVQTLSEQSNNPMTYCHIQGLITVGRAYQRFDRFFVSHNLRYTEVSKFYQNI
ncbi:MAG: hypothetical protein R2827_09560 [Bdellovibrionales bacterium]